MTTEEKETINKINQMKHLDMASMWRFNEGYHPYFDNTKPFAKVFEDRLFNHFGGFTPEISKKIGW
ncbi:MAG: hypothetical protein KAU20_05740 [Nanoarchaeota archaeon]|nr:hypothetical protein [Nanoarchaeota archaeon]